MAKAVTILMVILFVNSVSSKRKFQDQRERIVDSDRIVFPDSNYRTAEIDKKLPMPNKRNESIQEMSLTLARRFNEINDIEQFLDAFVENKNDYYEDIRKETPIFAARIGFDSKSRSVSVPLAKPAGCIPELTVVPVVPDENRNSEVFHIPTCTRVTRCGGCCNNNLLSCQPTEINRKQFKIYELTHRVNKPIYKKIITVTLEEHIKCACDCTVKEKDCNSLQEYNKNECKCVCKNFQAEMECASMSDRYWDSSSCTCNCIGGFACSTGTSFNQQTCNCK